MTISHFKTCFLPVLAILALCLAPLDARASYEEHLSTRPAAPVSGADAEAPLPLPGLDQRGRAAPFPAGSSGTLVPASHALALVTPMGWICSGVIPGQSPMSWDADESWPVVMERLAIAGQSRVILDWENRLIVVQPAKALPAPAAAARQAEKAARDEAQAKTAATAQNAAQTGPAPAAREKTHARAPARAQKGPSGNTAQGTASAAKAAAGPKPAPAAPASGTMAKTYLPAASQGDFAKDGLNTANPGSRNDRAPSTPQSLQTSFSVSPGSLRAQLEDWTGREGWRLVWKADTDLELDTGAQFTGSFIACVRSLFEGLRAAGAPFTARLYHANRVLTVEDR